MARKDDHQDTERKDPSLDEQRLNEESQEASQEQVELNPAIEDAKNEGFQNALKDAEAVEHPEVTDETTEVGKDRA